MSNFNFTLKNPQKSYIWSVETKGGQTFIHLTTKLTLSELQFHHQVGQCINKEIKEMRLIGYELVKDHWGNDVETIYKNTNTFMKQEILDTFNNSIL